MSQPRYLPDMLSIWPLSADGRIDRKKDKAERKILDSQERAFWDVHRPVVRNRNKSKITEHVMGKEQNESWEKKKPYLDKKNLSPLSPSSPPHPHPQPGCVNTTEMDIRKCRREKNPHRVKKVSLLFMLFFLVVGGRVIGYF